MITTGLFFVGALHRRWWRRLTHLPRLYPPSQWIQQARVPTQCCWRRWLASLCPWHHVRVRRNFQLFRAAKRIHQFGRYWDSCFVPFFYWEPSFFDFWRWCIYFCCHDHVPSRPTSTFSSCDASRPWWIQNRMKMLFLHNVWTCAFILPFYSVAPPKTKFFFPGE